MAVTTAVLQQATNTTTGNQDFTTTDFGGGTPKAALIFSAGSVDTADPNIRLSWAGYDDSVAGGCIASMSKDAQGNAAERRSFSADDFIIKFGNSIEAQGAVSFITNGVRINWSNAPSAARLLTVVLLGGASLSSDAHVWPSSISNGGTTTATTNFPPHLIIAGSNDAPNRTSQIDVEMGMGAYDWDGGTSPFNASYGLGNDNWASTSESYCQYSESDIVAFPNGATGGANGRFDLTAITSTSYTITNNSGGTMRYGWSLALNVDTNGYKVWSESSPTATGNWSVTTPGFKPQLVIGLLGFNTAEGVVSSGTGCYGYAICAFTPDAEFCQDVWNEDAQANTDCGGGASSAAVRLRDATGAAAFDATFSSMDANGFTLNFTAADSTARNWIFIAIEEDQVGDTSNLAQGSATATGFAPTGTSTEKKRSNLPQGATSATGFAPSVTLTEGEDHDTTLGLGTATSAGFSPTVTLTQNSRSNLPQGASSATGFAPTATKTENVRSNIPLGSISITTYPPAVTKSEHITSNLAQGAVTVTGFVPTTTLLEGDGSFLELGTISVTGYAPDSTLTQDQLSQLALAEYTATGFQISATLTQDQLSTLQLGTATSTGFEPTVTLTQNKTANLPAEAATASGFAPTATLTQNKRSNLVSKTAIVNGFPPLSNTDVGDVTGLLLGAMPVTGQTMLATLTQVMVSNLESGTVQPTGYAPTITVTGVAEAAARKGGIKHKKKKYPYQRKVMIGGVVYIVSSPAEELRLWEAYLERTKSEKPGRSGEIEARSILRKIEVVAKTIRAAEIQAGVDQRKEEVLISKYVQARRKIVQAKIRELLNILE